MNTCVVKGDETGEFQGSECKFERVVLRSGKVSVEFRLQKGNKRCCDSESLLIL